MLNDKRIVVTGANGGLGLAIAEACVRAGAIVGVNVHVADAAARKLAAQHPDRTVLLPFDVRDPDDIARGITQFLARSGGVDGWVNNAAVNRPDLLAVATPERIREQLDVNLLGPIFCARSVLPTMLEQRRGVIVNVGSVAAVRPHRGQSVYAATKGGLEALTRALAVEYARKGIRVHCLRPGPLDTPMLAATRALAEAEVLARVPIGRLGRPEEVAELCVHLLSDRSAFVTGSVHAIDGGYALG
jgi:NAD(P)-dependent dehydrogenase (short-subunit alcohol dehydrogenase family)